MLLKNLIKRISVGLVSAVVLTVTIAGPVMAAVPTTFSEEAQKNALTNVSNKLLYELIAGCYNNLKDEVTVSSGYFTWADLFNDSGSKTSIPYYAIRDDNGRITTERNKKLKCSEIMGGWKDKFLGNKQFPGIGYNKDKVVPLVSAIDGGHGTKEEVIGFLGDLGYEPTQESANEIDEYRCVWFQGDNMNAENGRPFATDKICAKQSEADENQVDTSQAIRVEHANRSDFGFEGFTPDGHSHLLEDDIVIFHVKNVNYDDGAFSIRTVGETLYVDMGAASSATLLDRDIPSNQCSSTFVNSRQWSNTNNGNVIISYCYVIESAIPDFGLFDTNGRVKVTGISTMTFKDLAGAFADAILTVKVSGRDDIKDYPTTNELNRNSAKIDPAMASTFRKGSTTFDTYMKYFLGDNYTSYGRDLTETEKYMLYWSGLSEVVTANSGATNGNVDYWLVGNSFKTDYDLSCSSDCGIATLVGSDILDLKAIEGSDPTVLELLNGINYDDDEFGEVEAPDGNAYDDIADPGNGGGGGKTECEQVDLNGQGWFLCPTLENLQNTTSVLDNQVENWLTVETNLYGSDSSTHDVWETMRNFGNWFIIIFLLIIIFSQLTGVGIDNYGIKKMLPKIIVMAIMINLSFIICEVAVDLSNILGTGLRDLFGGIGEVLINQKAGAGDLMENFIGKMTTAIFAAGGIAGVAAPTAIALAPVIIAGGPMAVIVVILTLLVILVAVLLFFIALGARMIIIIACIAVAPVAFALYILPNTQKIFKKWADLFKAALIVFPICGALSGVSKMVKGIVITTEGVHIWMLVVAMVAPYLVFFLLPSLLKGAIAALGVAGGALSSLGATLRSKTSSGLRSIQESEGFKENAEFGKAKMSVWRADRIKKKYGNKDLDKMSDRRRERIQNKLNNANKTKLAWEDRKGRNAIGADNELGYEQELTNSKMALENELEKKYAEGLQGETNRGTLAGNLEGIVNGADPTGGYDEGVGSAALASATLKSLLDKGGIDEAFSTLEGFDWGKMSGRMQRRLIDAMGGSNVEAFKGFAKYRRSGGTGNFGDWVKGDMSEAVREADAKNKAKVPSFGNYLAEGGIGALMNMSKEEIGKVSEHIDSIITPNGPIKQEDFGRMLVNQIINTKDSKAKVEGDKMLAELVGTGKLKAEDLGISANILGSMDKDTSAALDKGMKELAERNQEDAQKFKAALSEQAKAARSDSRVWNRMDEQTQNFVNKHWGADMSSPDVSKIAAWQRESQGQRQQVEVNLDTSQADGGELIIARDGSPNPPKYKKTFNINLKEGGE